MKAALATAMLCAGAASASAQAEVMAWGNLEGIRIEGQLMAFETGVCLQREDGSEPNRTSKERQRPSFRRQGGVVNVTSALGGISLRQTVEDPAPGQARIDLTVAADTQGVSTATLFCVDLPLADFAGGSVRFEGSDGGGALAGVASGDVRRQGWSRSVRFSAPGRELEIAFDAPVEMRVRRSQRGGGAIRLDVPLLRASPARGDSVRRTITITASGQVDRAAVAVDLEASRPGRAWDGLGGNFRLQNASTDPGVIGYNLQNLRVAWGRVEMPWRTWHPDEGVDPLAEARAGRIDPRSRAAMEMARDLHLRGIPVIVSAWFPPRWATVGGGELARPAGGPPGDALDPAKMERIYASIAGYLEFLKEEYGVEAAMFSFNESDLGIDVRQTAEEHAALIRGFGAYLGQRGLATRMLLGDTSDATAMDFIAPAMADAEALRHVAAVSFHSWRGWTDEILRFWGDAARRLNVPLLVGEGSTDAGAWRYPAIFAEPSFALQEIELYTRMMAIAEPRSILQWQLTADYSLLAGGGVFGDSSALRPTQRFWNLKQLAAFPAGFLLPVRCPARAVSCAAVGDIAGAEYTLHLVNRGAAREAVVRGLPPEIGALRLFVTDARRGMGEGGRVPVEDGIARFPLDAGAFTTVTTVLR